MLKTKTKNNILITTTIIVVMFTAIANAKEKEKPDDNILKHSWQIQIPKEKDFSKLTLLKDYPELETWEKIILIAREKNFDEIDYLLDLAWCESRFDENVKDNPVNNSFDRGVFQISRRYHPEVSDRCAHNLRCATEWTIGMINRGRQWEWACDSLI